MKGLPREAFFVAVNRMLMLQFGSSRSTCQLQGAGNKRKKDRDGKTMNKRHDKETAGIGFRRLATTIQQENTTDKKGRDAVVPTEDALVTGYDYVM